MEGKIFNQQTRLISFVLIGVGVLAMIYGFVSDAHRTWASLLVNNFFFLAIALAGIFFVAIQYVSNAGWSVAIKRVPEAMSTYLPYAGVGMLLIFFFGMHDLYHWTHHDIYDPASPHYDEIISNKAAYLNIPFFTIRTVVYILIWTGFAWLIRKNSLLADQIPGGDYTYFKKNFKLSAGFLVLFAITSSTSAWDWLMSIDTHWFSTLFGWYVFSGLFVRGLVTITLLIVFLKNKGLLPEVNGSHLHDLAKYVFAFSIFWMYLWVSQFLLIWYSNIPEEVTYYISRLQDYKVLMFTMLAINFVIPTLVLMTRTSKRKQNIVVITGIILIAGHWVDVFLMVMPGAVGSHASIGAIEIGTFLGFMGLFLFVVLKSLEKVPLMPKNHPYLEESLHHHT